MTAREVYDFGGFTLDVAERRLTSSVAGRISLAPKAHDLLVTLVRNAGRLLTKHELLELVWPESFVDEGILSVHVSSLRKALGDNNRASVYIETVSRTGYRFVAPVTATDAGRDARAARWSLAVLPAGQPDAGTAGDRPAIGLVVADALIERLGRVPQIVVRPARAVRPYITAVDEPAAIAQALQVDAVVASRLVTTGDRVAVSAQLIASDGATLWTGEFERPGTELAAIADAIAESIIARLGVSIPLDFPFVPGGGTSRTGKAASRPLEAYELFGRGRAHLLTASDFEMPKAVQAFRAAIALDSTYAGAYAGLALACCAQAELHTRPHLEAYAEAKTAALRALAMDDQCADAQVALGTVLFFSEWDWAGAERSFARALELNPNHTEAYLHYGSLMEATGRLDRGLALKQQALERDPFSAMVRIQIATSYAHQRRYDDVIVWANKALELDPKHVRALEFLSGAYWMRGDIDRFLAANFAEAQSRGATEAELADLRRSGGEMREAYAADGRPGLARYMLASTPWWSGGDGENIQRAFLHAQLGELDSAFACLDKGFETRDPSLVHLAVAPQWDLFRDDPRFDDCLARMGLRT